MSYTDSDRVLALAGVFQAAQLTTEIARHGKVDTAALKACVHSLYEFNPDSVGAVFEGVAGVRMGLLGLVRQLDEPQRRDLEITRYVVSLLQFERRLRREPQRLEGIGRDLDALGERRARFDLEDTTHLAQIAAIYQDHISPMSPPILVRGEALHLQNPDHAARIRVSLLAGIRAAMLWRQCGGRRWQMLFQRRRLARLGRALMEEHSVTTD
jgi:high frequency lysogenization protein